MRSSFHVNPEDHEHACRLLEALCEGYVLAMIEEIDAFPDGEFPCCVKCGGFRTRNAPLTPAQAEALEETLEHGHPVSGLQRHNLAAILEAHGYGIPTEQGELEHGIDPEQLEEGIDPEPLETNPAAMSAREAAVDVPSWALGSATWWHSQAEAPVDPPAADPSDYRQPAPSRAAALALEAAARNPAPPGSVPVRSAREILNSGGGNTVELACFQCAQKRREGADVGAKVIIVCTVPGTYRGVVLQSAHHIKAEKRGCIDDPVKDARPVGGCGCTRTHAPG